jgi:hypothetical protein
MKGIIAEIQGSHMIVIAKNGDFTKCKKLPNCNIGDEVNIPTRNMSSIYRKISTIAASFIILVMLSTGVYAYYTPYSYVSVDINPSLELYVNRFDKVIDVHAYNADAQLLLNTSASIKNKGIGIALEQIIDSAADKGFLEKDAENSVMIVVSSNNKEREKALTSKISRASTVAMSKVSSSYEVILEKTKVESFKKAHKDNISPGKVILANEFKEAKPELNEEEIKHMPLQQAIKQIEKKNDENERPDKPNATTAGEKPKVKNEPKGSVMNVKELIKEKNEELGKKIDQQNTKLKEKDKDKENDNDNDTESFNQKDEDKDKDIQKNDNEVQEDNSSKGDTGNSSTQDEDKQEKPKKDDKNKK